MKWGQYVSSVVRSHPEWSQYYLNYNMLKSELDDVLENNNIPHLSPEDRLKSIDFSTLKTFDEEEGWELKFVSKLDDRSINFYSVLNSQVAKVSEFFLDTYKTLEMAVKGYKDAIDNESVEKKPSTIALSSIYDRITHLRDFSTVNYTSVIKICKKHDKVLSVVSKEDYIKYVLNCQPFHTMLGELVLGLGSVTREMLDGLESDVSEEPAELSSDLLKTPRLSHRHVIVTSAASPISNYPGRALNNDVQVSGKLTRVVLCVPIRNSENNPNDVQVLVIKDGTSEGKLVKAEINTGETEIEAATRKMKDVAGVDVTLDRFCGEFASTSTKGLQYAAYTLHVVSERDEWKSGSEVRRYWMPLDEAISEIEDNTSIRVLRKVFG